MAKDVRVALAQPMAVQIADAGAELAAQPPLEEDSDIDALRDALQTATFTADEVRSEPEKSKIIMQLASKRPY
jgi:hypothetical protein